MSKVVKNHKKHVSHKEHVHDKKEVHHKEHEKHAPSSSHTSKTEKHKISKEKHTLHKVEHKSETHHSKTKVHSTSKTHSKVSSHKKLHSKEQPKKLFGQKFCPKCGAKIEHGVEFCKKCQSIDFNFKDIKIVVCNNCKSYLYKNKWAKFSDLSEVIDKVTQGSVKEHVDYAQIDPIEQEKLEAFKAGVNRDITIQAHIKRNIFDLPATFSVTLCPKCAKQGTKYFECIIQVRNSNEEINEFIRNETKKQAVKGIHLNKEESFDGSEENIDFYLTNQTYGKVLAEKLVKIYGGKIKKNAQLFSINWETAKNLYRLNILVEFSKYNKDEVIKQGKELFKIVSSDKKIHVLNLRTNTKTLLSYSNDYTILKPVEVLVMKKYPEHEILDPNTYYQARLMNPSKDLEINQKIHVVIDGSEAWMI